MNSALGFGRINRLDEFDLVAGRKSKKNGGKSK